MDSDQPIAFTGHDSWVNALTCSSDGQTLVSGGSDGRLVWWPAVADKPEPVRKIDAHQGWVRCLATSPNGQWLASGGNDHYIRLWNLADGTPVRELTGHDSHVYSIAFHPGGEFLLSGDLKGSIKQWQISDGSLIRSFDAKALHSYNGGQGVDFGGVRTLALSTDGKTLAAGGLHKAENPLGAVHEPLGLLFEWESQKLLRSHIAEGVKGVIWRVVFHPAGFLLGVSGGSGGGFLLFWKPDADKEFHRFQLPSLARDLDLHPDGVQIATAHYDRKIRLTRLAAKET
jgi:WD40 repeat protein